VIIIVHSDSASAGAASSNSSQAPADRRYSTQSVGVAAVDGDDDSATYRVMVLGGPGVGKTAITQQFLTSEYMAAQNTSFG
jgi:GTPase SAR1 family protein